MWLFGNDTIPSKIRRPTFFLGIDTVTSLSQIKSHVIDGILGFLSLLKFNSVQNSIEASIRQSKI